MFTFTIKLLFATLVCLTYDATTSEGLPFGKEKNLDKEVHLQSENILPGHHLLSEVRARAFQIYLKRHHISELPLSSFADSPNRIVGGEDAAEKEAPFQAQLFRAVKPWLPLPWLKERLSFICGGSFISPNTVLSAGHCYSPSIRYRIRYGSNSRLSSPYPALEVASITVHPNFSMATIANDLALFRLKTAVKPADNIQLIDLNREPSLPAGTNLTLFGFGLTNGLLPRPAERLQKAALQSVDEPACREFVEELGLNKTSGMICTQSNGKSACNVSVTSSLN